MGWKKAAFYFVLAWIGILLAWFVFRYRVEIGQVLMPFFMAVIIAYIVKPAASRLQRRKIPCSLSILLVYLLIILSIAAIGVFVLPELVNNARELAVTLPEIAAGYQQYFEGFMSMIRTSKWSEDVKGTLFQEIANATTAAQDYIAGLLKQALNGVIGAVGMLVDLTIAMVIAYYFIKDAGHFRDLLLALVPRRWRNGLITTGREIDTILSGFIQGQLVTALIVGILETIGLMIVGVRYPLILGMIGGLANVIPYFGPFIGAVPAVAVSLIESPWKALWTAGVFAVVQQIDNSFISPKVIEGRLGLHPVATILAVLVGGEFFGILGMLLSIPVMAILKVLVKRAVDAVV